MLHGVQALLREAQGHAGRASRDEGAVENGPFHGWFEAFPLEDVELRSQPAYRSQTDRATITSSAFGTTDIHTNKLSTGVDAQIRVDRPLAGLGSRFLAGFDYLHETTERNITSAFGVNLTDNARNIYAAYVQEELFVLDNLLLTAGLLSLALAIPPASRRGWRSHRAARGP